MNKLGTSLMLVGIIGMLSLPGCASNNTPGDEATSAAGDSLSTSATGRGQVVTAEQFVRGGGQPLTVGGDAPGDATTLYRCPKLQLTPSATINTNDRYSSNQAGHPRFTQAPIDTSHASQTIAWLTPLNEAGPWYLTRLIGCGVGISARGVGGSSNAELAFRKDFSTLQFCQFNVAPGDDQVSFVCKEAPSPI